MTAFRFFLHFIKKSQLLWLWGLYICYCPTCLGTQTQNAQKGKTDVMKSRTTKLIYQYPIMFESAMSR